MAVTNSIASQIDINNCSIMYSFFWTIIITGIPVFLQEAPHERPLQPRLEEVPDTPHTECSAPWHPCRKPRPSRSGKTITANVVQDRSGLWTKMTISPSFSFFFLRAKKGRSVPYVYYFQGLEVHSGQC